MWTLKNNTWSGRLDQTWKEKTETCGMPIKVFVGSKFKMHSFIAEDNHESKKAKKSFKNIIDDEPKYEDYKNVLFSKSFIRHEINRKQSKDPNIGSYRINTISFCTYND